MLVYSAHRKLWAKAAVQTMAIPASSSIVSGISIPSPLPFKAKQLGFSTLTCDSASCFRRWYHASCGRSRSALQPMFSRNAKLFRVRATTLQEDEEKVVVEKSFDPKSFPEKDGEGTSGQSPDGPPPSSDLEKSIIKIEQSINIFLTDSVIKILDSFYHDRNYARFFVLETIARVPYFAFMSVLHLYETFGLWRRADYLKVHFAESWNEMHHLLIMEELGGDDWWVDRFLAQSVAFVYYFVTVFMYFLSPRMAYHFSECVEHHAFETYDKFLKAEGEELMRLPAPAVAVKYYTGGDLYLFDEFQTSRTPESRRPKIDNLYDTFLNIRDDEAEHCKTMKACQFPGGIRSPHSIHEEEPAKEK